MKNFLSDPRLIGNAAYYLARLLETTLTLKVAADPAYDVTTPYLFAFWHGNQLLPVLQLRQHLTPKAALVSPSKDGDLLAIWLQRIGYTIVRGSSRDGNVRSLVALIKYLRDGYSIGFGIDGPIGPRFQVKPGLTFMAQKYQIPIVPLGSACAHKWIFSKAWDQYQIPKPCSKVGYYIGAPWLVPKDLPLERANIELGWLLHRTTLKAAELLF